MYLAYLTTHDDDYKRREPSAMYSEKTFKSEKKATEYIANELMDAILEHINDGLVIKEKSLLKYITETVDTNNEYGDMYYTVKDKYKYNIKVANKFREKYGKGNFIPYWIDYEVTSIAEAEDE